LLNHDPLANVVTAFSFTPEAVRKATEHRVPAIHKRVEAMKKLAEAGWPVALRIDPLIWHSDYQQHYGALFEQVVAPIPETRMHSVTIGPFRMPQQFFRNMEKLYPEEPLFAAGLAARGNMVSYPLEREHAMLDFCTRQLAKYLPDAKIFPNLPEDEA
jgi:spore photoproduct lyase